MADFRAGGYSPVYTRLEDLDPGTVTFLEEEDLNRRNFDQQKALKGAKVENVLTAEEKALEKEAKKGMGDDEATFSVESVLEQSYEWSDKYRPLLSLLLQGLLLGRQHVLNLSSFEGLLLVEVPPVEVLLLEEGDGARVQVLQPGVHGAVAARPEVRH